MELTIWKAYELYLIAQGLRGNPKYLEVDNIKISMDTIDAALVLDPEFANAWAMKSMILDTLSIFGSTKSSDMEREAALNAARRAVEIEPNMALGYFALVRCETTRGNWIDAELSYRKALELQTETLSQGEFMIAQMYDTVGYFKKSLKILEEIRRNDPLNSATRAFYIITLGLLGDMQGAENENERCKILFGDMWKYRSFSIVYHRLSSGDPVSIAEVEFSAPIFNALKEHFDSPKNGFARLHQLYSEEDNLSERDITDISLLAAYFGDSQFAMDTMEMSIKKHASGLFKVWFPVMKEVRQLPRFKEFVHEIGLVDYWKKYGWPDLCRPVGDDDFVCD